ncbi:MAG: gluconokinase [Gemmatimonadaceae bacterium]
MKKGLYVVMGVSGSGKSVVGAALARALDIDFVEGDDFHSPENIERMSSGIPLSDDDRAGWLRTLANQIHAAKNAGTGIVLSCSALKRSYRDILRAEADDLQFIFLHGSPELIAERIARRGGAHFMSPSLLYSQFAALEEPSRDEGVWMCDITESPEEIVAELIARIHDDR